VNITKLTLDVKCHWDFLYAVVDFAYILPLMLKTYRPNSENTVIVGFATEREYPGV